MHLQHLPLVQAEERKEEPQIDGALLQALFVTGSGRVRRGVCDVLHGSTSEWPAAMPRGECKPQNSIECGASIGVCLRRSVQIHIVEPIESVSEMNDHPAQFP
jgi:hypothetical protein